MADPSTLGVGLGGLFSGLAALIGGLAAWRKSRQVAATAEQEASDSAARAATAAVGQATEVAMRSLRGVITGLESDVRIVQEENHRLRVADSSRQQELEREQAHGRECERRLTELEAQTVRLGQEMASLRRLLRGEDH